MKAVGLIVEYNPFHNGHQHHLVQSKNITQSDAAVAVMSGHFLQRGEPALLDKWTRAEMALANGCDLVLELPVAYATSSAEWFAYGAVATLHHTGVVDSLCFGTESGRLEPLQAAAYMIVNQHEELHSKLQSYLQQGNSYPSAFSCALNELLTEQSEQWREQPISLAQPNHTLGLHYLVALLRLQSSITPYTIPREKAQYNDHTPQHRSIASATAIRKLLLHKQNLTEIAPYIPAATFNIMLQLLEEHLVKPMHWENFATALFYQLSTQSTEQLSAYREIEEGLEHRILRESRRLNSYSVEQLISAVKTKRYTTTKLQRALLSILLQHNKQHFTREKLFDGVQYIRVLGFNEKGKQLLKLMKKKSSRPIIHTPKQFTEHSTFLELDLAATRCYMLSYRPNEPKQQLADYMRPPILL